VKAGVILFSEDICKTTGICDATRGLAFRPESIEEGLALFEQQAFHQYSLSRKPPKYREKTHEASLHALAKHGDFRLKGDNQEIAAAASNQPLATPKLIIWQNPDTEIPDPVGGARGRRRSRLEVDGQRRRWPTGVDLRPQPEDPSAPQHSRLVPRLHQRVR
jgi:hypothetical protein